jgi:hypothetical protein
VWRLSQIDDALELRRSADFPDNRRNDFRLPFRSSSPSPRFPSLTLARKMEGSPGSHKIGRERV